MTFNRFDSISELLSQKQKFNKMSPQNIAIVMSPNLLWAPESKDADYVSKVNSTAAVNTIVEALVNDWTFFFRDDFTIDDFYVTISRDELFPDNGGFSVDRDPPANDSIMTKSLNITTSMLQELNNHSHSSMGGGYQTHSRSSSHDTSLILLGGIHPGNPGDDPMKRSQSNSSLSDSSPQQQSSPKLPVRRKHNKQVAPTPPDTRFQRSADHYAGHHMMHHSLFGDSRGDKSGSDDKLATSSVFKPPPPPSQAVMSMRQCHGSTENLISKPDKPPRPAMPVECQTLIRNAFKSKTQESKQFSSPGKPVALPRNILNVARSTENLSTTSTPGSPGKSSSPTAGNHQYDVVDDHEPVQFRDNHHQSNPN